MAKYQRRAQKRHARIATYRTRKLATWSAGCERRQLPGGLVNAIVYLRDLVLVAGSGSRRGKPGHGWFGFPPAALHSEHSGAGVYCHGGRRCVQRLGARRLFVCDCTKRLIRYVLNGCPAYHQRAQAVQAPRHVCACCATPRLTCDVPAAFSVGVLSFWQGYLFRYVVALDGAPYSVCRFPPMSG